MFSRGCLRNTEMLVWTVVSWAMPEVPLDVFGAGLTSLLTSLQWTRPSFPLSIEARMSGTSTTVSMFMFVIVVLRSS